MSEERIDDGRHSSNRHDTAQLDAQAPAIPRIREWRRRKPQVAQGDWGDSSEPHGHHLCERGIAPLLAQIGSPHSSGPGKTRWQVAHTIAWHHSFRHLEIRYQHHAHIHEAFLSSACTLIRWTRLTPLLNAFRNGF